MVSSPGVDTPNMRSSISDTRTCVRSGVLLTSTLLAVVLIACAEAASLEAGARAETASTPLVASASEGVLVERVWGPDRVRTAIEVSKRAFPRGAPAVVIATGLDFPDALAGGPLAHVVGGPVLLVTGDGLPSVVASEVRRLAPDRAFVLGGPNAVPPSVDAGLRALGVAQVERLAGSSRYETAAEIAHQMRLEGAGSEWAVAVSGRNWPDAASAGPVAATLGAPIVLVNGDDVPAASRQVLAEWGTTRTLVAGGPAAVPDEALSALPAPERVAGPDRYATARRLAVRGLDLGLATGTVVVASGEAFPDAIAGTPLAAGELAPILLSASGHLSDEAARYISAHSEETTHVILLGGTRALSTAVEGAVGALLGAGGAAGWPDTTDGIVVFSDQLDESMTDAQAAFVASRYAGSQKQTRSFARRLRSYDPDYLVIHYRLGLGLGYRAGGSWVQIIEGDDWVREWPDSPEDSWFYLFGGERVLNTTWGWYLVDPDDASWRSWWTSEVERQIAANEDDGLFIDSYSVPNFLGADEFAPALPAFDPDFEAEWTARIDRYSAYLVGRPALRPVIANAGSWVTSRDEVRYDLLDGVMIEALGEWGPGTPYEEGDWVLQQDRIISLARQGKIVLGQSYLDAPSDTTTRRMATASYLMSKGPRSYLCLEMGPEPEWFPEYDLDLGAPTDALPGSVDEFRLPSGLYRRRFERGVVLVNPTDAPVTAPVADVAGAGEWDLAVFSGGGTLPEDADVSGCRIDRVPASEVIVAPHDAAFLLRR